MLDFMRKNADKIIIGTLVLFVLSLGIIGYNKPARGAGKKSSLQFKTQGVVAQINGKEINQRYFMRMHNMMLNNYKTPDQKDLVDPKLEAYIQYDALSRTMDFEKYLLYAQKLKIRVSGGELNQQINAIINGYGIKSKREFKEILKRNGYQYNDFTKDIRNEMKVNKMLMLAKKNVLVTDKDVTDQYKKVKARHILVIYPFAADEDRKNKELFKERQKQAREKIAQIYDQLVKGEDFAKAAREFSDDKGSAVNGGDLGFFGVGTMVPEFEQVAFALDKGQMSKPFETQYGFHIVKVEDINQGALPLDVDANEVKKGLLEKKQQEAVQAMRQKIDAETEQEIFLPVLKAYDYRVRGELDKALGEYRLISSQAPQSPFPYLFTADIFEVQKQYDKALAEYNKALLVEKLNPGTKTPFIHFYLGKMYAKQKMNAAAAKEFQTAEVLVKDDLKFLERLRDAYKESGYTALSAKTGVRVKAMENALKAKEKLNEEVNFDEKSSTANKK